MGEINTLELPFPLPPFLELLNIGVLEIGDGYARLSMPFHERLKQPFGVMHGGAIFSLADGAVAYAIAGMVDRTKQFVTIEMKMNYLAPVTEGIVEAKAKVLKRGRIVPADVEVFNENKLVAKAIATYIILDEKKKL